MKIFLPVLLVIVYTIGLLFSGGLSKNIGLTITDNHFINRQLNYQILLLIITAISLVTTFILNRENFLIYFSIGNISKAGNELKIFGIKQGDSWIKTGLSLSVVITLITSLFMFLQLKQFEINWSLLKTGILWILLFSLSNSFGEEMIYRIGIIAPLKGLMEPTKIFLISAVIFGFAHINGMPNGIIGIGLASILGFVLAKSVYEIEGFFWAWVIHFLQDVVIISSLYLMNKNI